MVRIVPTLVAFVALVTALTAPGVHLHAQEATPSPVTTSNSTPVPVSIAGGGVTINVIDPERMTPATDGGAPFRGLPGACFAVYATADAAHQNPVAGACSDADGFATIRGLPEGDYVLVQTTAPAGYRPSATPQSFAMVYDQIYLMTIENLAYGSVTFRAMGDSGEPLTGACIAIYAATGDRLGRPVSRDCDGDDGSADGATLVSSLTTGEYTAVEVSAPAGYLPVSDQTFTVTGASGHEFAVTHQRLPMETTTSIGIIVSDVVSEQFGGACYQLSGPREIGPVCDGDATDAAPLAGQIRIDGVDAGQYTIHETTPPTGLVSGVDVVVTVANGQHAEVVIIHAEVAATPDAVTASDGASSLIVRTVDETGAAVTGACFEIMAATPQDDGSFVGTGACDADDGLADGTTTISELPADNNYFLTQSATTPGYERIPDTAVAVSAGQVVTITVVNASSKGSA